MTSIINNTTSNVVFLYEYTAPALTIMQSFIPFIPTTNTMKRTKLTREYYEIITTTHPVEGIPKQ